jgi:hypothetical protein
MKSRPASVTTASPAAILSAPLSQPRRCHRPRGRAIQ